MEQGSSLRRLGGVLAVALVAALAGVCSHAQPAHADTLLDAKRARYAHVRTEIRHLDNHAEMLTEQYDKVVWQLGRAAQADADRHAPPDRRAGQAPLRAGGAGPAARRAVQGRRPAHDRDRARGLVALPGGRRHGSEAAPGHGRRRHGAGDQRRQAGDRRGAARHRRRPGARAGRQAPDHHPPPRDPARAAQAPPPRRHPRPADHRHDGRRPHRPGRSRARGAEVAHGRPARPTPPIPGQELRDQIALEALQQIGVPYVWGGATPSGLRLLRPRHVAVGEARRRAAALRRLAVPHGAAHLAGRSCAPATWSSSTTSATSPSTSATAGWCTRRTPATGCGWSASRWAGSRPRTSAPRSPARPEPPRRAAPRMRAWTWHRS